MLEIGCWLGAAVASKMLRRTGYPKRYVCVDTFSGFVPEQFEHDQQRGVPEHRTMHDANSRGMVEGLLNRYGASEIELLEGGNRYVAERPASGPIAVCLIDVDLEIPVYESLRRILPRLGEGGSVLVDDCPEQTSWAGARLAYRRFVAETRGRGGTCRAPRLGMGLIGGGQRRVETLRFGVMTKVKAVLLST